MLLAAYAICHQEASIQETQQMRRIHKHLQQADAQTAVHGGGAREPSRPRTPFAWEDPVWTGRAAGGSRTECSRNGLRGLLRCESQRNARGRGTHAAVDDPTPEMQGPYVMSPPPIPLERFLLIPSDGRHSGAGGISGDHQHQRLGGESVRHKDQGLGSRQAPASIRRPADERSANLAGAWSSAALHDGAKHPAVTATPSGTPVATGSG